MAHQERSPMKLLVLLLALAACTHDSRQDTIHAALVTVDIARDEFALVDDAAQQRIVTVSTSVEEARVRLADYRTQRDKGPAADLTVAYRAIAVAAAANDARTLSDMSASVTALLVALKPYIAQLGAK